MLWKCCTQHASKFAKLGSGHRTEKGQFLFQSQRRAMPECSNYPTIVLAKYCSKFSKPGFNDTWNENFQMFKLDLEKAEEQEIRLPTSAGSSKKQESSRKTSISALLTTPKPLSVWITKKLWKILQKIGVPEHLTYLLRNLCAGQEAAVRTGHGTTDWFQIGKGIRQGCHLDVLSPCLFNFCTEYIMWNDGLDEAQAGIKIVRRNINNIRYADDTTLMAESQEELRSFLMKVKKESEKLALKSTFKRLRSWHPIPSLHGK